VSRSASFELLPGDLLTSLCESRCAEELEAIRTAIKEACTADTDVLVPEEDVAYPGTWIEYNTQTSSAYTLYPATYLADRYLYATQLNCLKS
jgi:hypothetical protein